ASCWARRPTARTASPTSDSSVAEPAPEPAAAETSDSQPGAAERARAPRQAPPPATAPAPGKFDADTAVWPDTEAGDGVYAAVGSPDWRAGRGPHGGYLAAIVLRALTTAVADARRTPRSLTIHYTRAPEPGPVTISTTVERAGRSLSTLSARMEQDG